MTLRVGIISANWGAFAHLPAWRANPGVEVVGICTSRRETAEAAARTYDIPRPYWDAAEMIADPDIDIIDSGTRPILRQQMALSALQQGKHVYSGIPFAADLEGARALWQAQLDSGKVGVVDAPAEWIPAHRLAKELIEDGSLGAPHGGVCQLHLALFNKPEPDFAYNWFWQAGLGVSALRNLGSHALHTLHFLFGAVEEVVAVDTQILSEWKFPDGSLIRPETNDYASLLLRFKTGLTLQLQVSWSATITTGWSLDVFGSHGRLVARSPNFPTAKDTTLAFGLVGAATVERMEVPDRLLHAPDVGLHVDSFPPPAFPISLAISSMIQAIKGDGVARPSFEQAWNVERALEAARRSSLERRWVQLSEVA